MFCLGETGDQFWLLQFERNLAGAGITETARPQGDVDLIGLIFNITVIECYPIFIIKIGCNRATALSVSRWP